MTGGAGDRREVWLRGNVRPVAGLAAVTATVAASAIALAITAGTPRWGVWAGGSAAAVAVTGLAAVGLAAARPRLARRGDGLEIRLSPAAVERVPLEAVECVFRGSEPVPAGGNGGPRFRVGTLVVRFAERAIDLRSRPTFRPWGTWDDGHAVVDGRWCEPLTRETVERVAGLLRDAKRQAATGGGE